jgi:predicted pyridoxine 5'-phosphate oxidase superfamily flavin-nucleotide-binding protein
VTTRSPFHPGEQAVQTRVGVRAKLEQIGPRIMRDFMPDQHRELFEELPFLVAGSADGSGALWASLLIGEPGFVRSPTPRSLLVHGEPLPGDPLLESVRAGAALGLLGIELPTRRRNRANGHVAAVRSGAFEVRVEQSFGNCPKYIQARGGYFTRPGPPAREGALLSEAAEACLARSDTSFIATSSRSPDEGGREGLDVSHRGGRPGFIRVQREAEQSLLTMPDFLGNFMFNTLGNLEVDPRAGLLVLDFQSGALLSLTGRARVIWDGPELESCAGAERLLEFRVERGLLWRDVAQHWSAPEPSPHLP